MKEIEIRSERYMDLWIRSQDRTNLVKVCNIYLNYPQKNKIIANYIPDLYDGSGPNYDILGTYKSQERALEILDEIQDLLQNAYVGNSCRLVYNMPKE